MADYQAPMDDINFLLKDVFDVESQWSQIPRLSEVTDFNTAIAVLEEAGKFAAGTISPLNRQADEVGCTWHKDGVTTAPGFKEAYAKYAEGGWVSVSGDPQYGGMGMPKVISAIVEEITNSACLSFGLHPMLTTGACMAINMHATEPLKETYLTKMYTGIWAGSMCLTEPHAGTDLGMIKTKAEPQADGSYKISGTKIFITAGEHDLTENIIHLVLAKLPNAPASAKGISLFLVPKVMVNEDGSLGERNLVSCGSIEHKMGIKASATCVMNFDGAKGWMIGEANKGLAAMFTMMNYERLGVGIQALAVGERSYQSAVEYARERLQSRAPTGIVAPDKPADPIIVHPDVRRMLLTMRALNEGGRAFSVYVAMQLDCAKFHPDADMRHQADEMVALLTPVAKSFMSDMAFETTILGQQIYGGHGYIREWGQEQLVRDCRITQIYEGTNGIQALDLVGRKLVSNGGVYYHKFTNEIRVWAATQSSDARLPIQALLTSLTTLDDLTQWVMQASKTNPNEMGAASMDYMMAFGYVTYAYMWAKMMSAAYHQSNNAHAQAKISVGNFYFARMLPRLQSLVVTIKAGSNVLYELTAEQF